MYRYTSRGGLIRHVVPEISSQTDRHGYHNTLLPYRRQNNDLVILNEEVNKCMCMCTKAL